MPQGILCNQHSVTAADAVAASAAAERQSAKYPTFQSVLWRELHLQLDRECTYNERHLQIHNSALYTVSLILIHGEQT